MFLINNKLELHLVAGKNLNWNVLFLLGRTLRATLGLLVGCKSVALLIMLSGLFATDYLLRRQNAKPNFESSLKMYQFMIFLFGRFNILHQSRISSWVHWCSANDKIIFKNFFLKACIKYIRNSILLSVIHAVCLLRHLQLSTF